MWLRAVQIEALKESIRFAVVGVGNTALGLAVIYVGIRLGYPDFLANIAGYIAGLLVGFSYNRNWTFRSEIGIVAGMTRYLLAFVVAYSLNLTVVLSLRHTGVAALWAHTVGVIPYTISFFLISRYFVFAQPRENVPSSR